MEEWSDAAAEVVVGVEVEVVIVVSLQRRRLGLIGWVWNLSWVVVAAIWDLWVLAIQYRE